MGQSDDVEDSTYSRHQELCQKLNMDASAASTAWRSYSNIRQNYTLEVKITKQSTYSHFFYSCQFFFKKSWHFLMFTVFTAPGTFPRMTKNLLRRYCFFFFCCDLVVFAIMFNCVWSGVMLFCGEQKSGKKFSSIFYFLRGKWRNNLRSSRRGKFVGNFSRREKSGWESGGKKFGCVL